MAMGLGSKRPVTDINVTPLIDVVLVLLIIFMVLTPLAEKQKFLRVLKSGAVLLNKQPMSVEEAMQRLRPAYDGRPSKVLFFNCEDEVKYEQAMRVLDAAHGVGVNTIGMMTDPPITAAADGAPAPQ